MDYELKPCMCGHKTPEITKEKHPFIGETFGVICDNCGLYMDCRKHSKQEAIEFWNTRPIEDALQSGIQQLTTENGNLKHHIANLEQKLYFLSHSSL
jgi:transcription elongation factor Elf1